MKEKIRLQKYCSERGIASRRKTEEYIQKGWITVNGTVVTELGTRVDPEHDTVELLPQAKEEAKEYKYLLLNKPHGYVSNLPQAREKEASELLSPIDRKDTHVVGRLDKDSEGLLFFTNDGRVANRLKSPEFHVEKEYEVTVDHKLSRKVIERFEKGMRLSGEQLRPVRVTHLTGNTYEFILTEGKNRQIRRMLKTVKCQVVNLKRMRIGPLNLKGLQSGRYRHLARGAIAELLRVLDVA